MLTSWVYSLLLRLQGQAGLGLHVPPWQTFLPLDTDLLWHQALFRKPGSAGNWPEELHNSWPVIRSVSGPPGHLLTFLKQFWVVRFKDVLDSSCSWTSASPALWRTMELNLFCFTRVLWNHLGWVKLSCLVGLSRACCFVFLLSCHWMKIICLGTPNPELWSCLQ